MDFSNSLTNFYAKLNNINITEVSASLDILSKASLSLLELVIFSAIILFLILIVMRIIFPRKMGLVVLPFEVASDLGLKYSGKMISDLFAKELQRIDAIHQHKFADVPIKSEIKFPGVGNLNKELSKLELTPKRETIDYGTMDLGTVGFGSTSLSLSNIIITFRRIIPLIKPIKIISGNVGIFGSIVKLTACLEGREMLIFEAENKVKIRDSPDMCIPNLVKDIAYQVRYELEKLEISKTNIDNRLSARTWQGFKHLTESRDFYHLYTLTGKTEDLERAKQSCICAALSEQNYEMAINMLYFIGLTYLYELDLSSAEEIFNNLSKFDSDRWLIGNSIISYLKKDFEAARLLVNLIPENSESKNLADYNGAIYLFKQERWQEALDAFGKCDKDDPEVNKFKGLASFKLDSLEDSLTAFDKVTKIEKENANAWFNKALVLFRLGRWEDADKANKEALRIAPDHTEAIDLNLSIISKEMEKSAQDLIRSLEKFKKDPSKPFEDTHV